MISLTVSVCANCGAGIDHVVQSDLCTQCLLIKRSLSDFLFFFENVYMPSSRATYHQKLIASYIQECIDEEKPIRLAVQKGRRVGASEICCAFDLWYAVRACHNNEKRSVAIFSIRMKTAKDLFREKIHPAMKNHPWLMSLVPVVGRTHALLETQVRFISGDTKIYADTAGENAARGSDNDVIHFSEAQYISDAFYQAALQSSLSGDNHIIMESTPQAARGIFHRACTDDDSPFTVIKIPTFELNESGHHLVGLGLHASLTPEHFLKNEDGSLKINAINATFRKLSDMMQGMTTEDVKMEYLGLFFSGSELMFPPSLTGPVSIITPDLLLDYGLYGSKQEMDADVNLLRAHAAEMMSDDEGRKKMFDILLAKRMCVVEQQKDENPVLMRWSAMNERLTINNMEPWSFLMAIDWGRKDWTVTTIWGVRERDRLFQLIAVRAWNKVDYDDSFGMIAEIHQFWSQAGAVVTHCDVTGMQDQALAALVEKGVYPCIGFNMQVKAKKDAARTAFVMMQERKLRLFKHAQLLSGLGSVDYFIKGEDGHLNDYAASVLIAIHREHIRAHIETADELPLDQMVFQI